VRSSPGQERLLRALETVLDEFQTWQTARLRIGVQLTSDFQLSSPTDEEVGAMLEDYGVFAMALRLVAGQLEEEVEESVNRYYDWLCD
jgi:type VI protein secretion system component VasK